MIDNNLSIGKNLRRIRRDCDLTQDQVVAQMENRGFKMSRSIYSKIEQGDYNIRVSEIMVLALIFKVRYNDFFDGLIPTIEEHI